MHDDKPDDEPMTDEIDPVFDDRRLTAMGLLTEVYAAISAEIEHDLADGGLTGSLFEVMIRLCRSPGGRLRMTELATQSTLTSSGLTRVVDRLERDGFVRREPCEHDRRGFWASITDAGLERMTAILPGHLEAIDRAFTSVIAPDELDRFLTTLRAIRAAVSPGSDPQVSSRVAAG